MPSNGFAVALWVAGPPARVSRCVTDSNSKFVYVLDSCRACSKQNARGRCANRARCPPTGTKSPSITAPPQKRSRRVPSATSPPVRRRNPESVAEEGRRPRMGSRTGDANPCWLPHGSARNSPAPGCLMRPFDTRDVGRRALGPRQCSRRQGAPRGPGSAGGSLGEGARSCGCGGEKGIGRSF
jgi:hypothetical protein